jgi:[ribosomal protein S5]-alanine N-acetyltransferase
MVSAVGPADASMSLALVPLDRDLVERRLREDDFCVSREIAGDRLTIHFPPEFPGEALALYPSLVDACAPGETIVGTYFVVDLDHREVVGQLGAVAAPVDGELEFGYGINPSARGRGVGTAAVAMLIPLLRREFPGLRLVARTLVGNLASIRVLMHQGFVIDRRESTEQGEFLVWAL